MTNGLTGAGSSQKTITIPKPVTLQTAEQDTPVLDAMDTGGPSSSVKPRSTIFPRSISALMTKWRGTLGKAAAAAMLFGMFAVPTHAQTRVNEGVPLKAVDVRISQQQALGDSAYYMTRLRTDHTLLGHRQRAALTVPALGTMSPLTSGPQAVQNESLESIWRMISIAAESAEGTAELTNMIPTLPVEGKLLWQPELEDANGKKFDVLPRLFPQLANRRGNLDKDALMDIFSRVNAPYPAADADGVFLAENVGFQNGRAGYFSINATNPEPVQPHSDNGTLLLPQLTLEVNGQKTIYTIGSLCYKGGGPSFRPDGSYSYGYSGASQKTPLNMTERKPVYSGNTNFGMFGHEPDAKTNDNGWMLLEHGAYAGMSIMQIGLEQLVDYPTDEQGRITGPMEAISVDDLKEQGRLAQDLTPTVQWRAFATEYRLSSFKNPDEGVAVLSHMRQLFARDAIFDHIANTPDLSSQWAAALESANTTGKMDAVTDVWKAATESLNATIVKGDHSAKDSIIFGEDGVATMSVEDYMRTAIARSARNILVLHKLGFNHGSIASGGDNINAAWQMVDLDHLDTAHSLPDDPKDHRNISEFTSNIEAMITDLGDRVPEFAAFKGQVRDLIKQEIDRQAPIYGKQPAPDTPAQDDGNG